MNHTLHGPVGEVLPLLLDSPHSGNTWPDDWRPVAPRAVLESGWDAFVNELFRQAPTRGAALLEAHFPRMFIDLNRGRLDIDPEMVEGDWPVPLVPTERSAKGFGLLRRQALPGVPVYGAKLPVAQVEAWLTAYYDPYHDALAAELDALQGRFGQVWFVDCHSMKSRGNAMNDDPGRPRPDFVVSDRDGTSADPEFTRFAAEALRSAGFKVGVNDPYKGAELILRHTDPAGGRHGIQIEINRALYMNEAERTKGQDFTAIATVLDRFVAQLAGFVRSALST